MELLTKSMEIFIEAISADLFCFMFPTASHPLLDARKEILMWKTTLKSLKTSQPYWNMLLPVDCKLTNSWAVLLTTSLLSLKVSFHMNFFHFSKNTEKKNLYFPFSCCQSRHLYRACPWRGEERADQICLWHCFKLLFQHSPLSYLYYFYFNMYWPLTMS